MKNVIMNYINKNKFIFIIISIIFCIGIAIGIISINMSSDVQKNEINIYITNLLNHIKSNENIDRIQLLFLSIKNNVLLIVIIWILGCTIIGGPIIYLVILYKGFLLGYTISALVAVLGIKTGTLFAISSLTFQNIIFLPFIFIMAENGIMIHKDIKIRSVNLRIEVIKYTIIMFITTLVSILASFVEVYCSTSLLVTLTTFL